MFRWLQRSDDRLLSDPRFLQLARDVAHLTNALTAAMLRIEALERQQEDSNERWSNIANVLRKWDGE